MRASVIFLFLWVVTRAMGKRELAEMSPFELLFLITVGDLIQQGVTQEDFSLTGAMLAVATIALWILAASWATFRWKRFREVAEGVPVVVVRHGKPLEDMLKLERVTLGELMESAREQGIGDLAEVDVAILEPDGTFAFLGSGLGHHAAPERHQE